MEVKNLIGKTIKLATKKKLKGFDDKGFLELTFTDGSVATIVAKYGEYSENSLGEYPTDIELKGKIKGLK